MMSIYKRQAIVHIAKDIIYPLTIMIEMSQWQPFQVRHNRGGSERDGLMTSHHIDEKGKRVFVLTRKIG